jgi:uncharacterized protein
MKHSWAETSDHTKVEYLWRKAKKWNSFQIKAPNKLISLDDGSETEFITEHYWGYARIDQWQTNEYQVKHPKWKVYEIESYKMNVDFPTVYGEDFGFLSNKSPHSVMLAEGSEIAVENKKKLFV